MHLVGSHDEFALGVYRLDLTDLSRRHDHRFVNASTHAPSNCDREVDVDRVGRVPPYQIRKIEHHCFVFEHPGSAGAVDKFQSSDPWNGLISKPGDVTSADVVANWLVLPRH